VLQNCGQFHIVFLRITAEIIYWIVEVCEFQLWQFSDAMVTAILNVLAQNSVQSKNQATLTLQSVVNVTRSRNRILEKCKFQFGVDYVCFQNIAYYGILYKVAPNYA